jgi:peptide/nickel transport system substrate-binding protein
MRILLAVLLAAVTAFPAHSERFKCGRVGGSLTFGLEGNVASLDQHMSNATSARDISMSIHEVLVTRDEDMKPLLLLAESLTTSNDSRVFTFKLRRDIHFHNGKLMTSADVLASFERYQRVGLDRAVLEPVSGLEAPDAATFGITLKEPLPTFMESLSSITVPIVIVPTENASAPPQQLAGVGLGPWELVEYVPNSHVKLKRFEGYSADTRHEDRTGFGGYKVACLDTVTFRMVTEPGARVAGLQTGELGAVQDVPVLAQKRLADDKNIKLETLENYWLNLAWPNWSAPPTDNLYFRQAVAAALDFDEIMDAASDGVYRPTTSLQIAGTTYYSEAGRPLLNQRNPDKAKRLLAQSGYHGEKVVLLVAKDYPSRYNTAVVMAQQMKAVGIEAVLEVQDWPTALQRSLKGGTDWNFFFSAMMTYLAQGGTSTLRTMAEPSPLFSPPGKKVDPDFMRAFHDVAYGGTVDIRRDGFARAQQIAIESVMVLPFGVMPKVQGIRSNVRHYKPFWNPRLYNVWLAE